MNKNTLILHGDKAEEWKAVIGTDRVPVTAPISIEIIDREGKHREAFMVDFQAWDRDTQQRVVDHIARKFSATSDDVEETIMAEGLPITVDDCEWTLASNDLLRYAL